MGFWRMLQGAGASAPKRLVSTRMRHCELSFQKLIHLNCWSEIL